MTDSSDLRRTAIQQIDKVGSQLPVRSQHDGRPERRAIKARIPWFAIALLGSTALIAAALAGKLPAWVGVGAVILMVLIVLVRWGWQVLDCELL